MGELKKLTAQELDELREQLKAEQDKTRQASERQSLEAPRLLTVTISEDKMLACVNAQDPGPGEVYTKEEIMTRLRKNNIVRGIDETAVDRIVAGLCYGQDVPVANGQPLKQGKDGSFELFFQNHTPKEPVIREDGTADYSAMGRLENISVGDVVARYYPAEAGEKGYTVTGAELVPRMTRDIPPLRGKNIFRNDETGEYTATAAGKISYTAGNIEILTLHEIHGDVDLITGTVEFYGDIVIYGNVESGVMIRAGRNLTVTGTVGPARLFAGGDIVLEKGIQGGEKGTVSARGNVFAEFVEYARVDAGMDVSAGSIINSMVKAGGNVILKGKRASIMGGNVHALHSISAKSVGGVSEMRTILHTGFSEEDYRAFAELVSREKMQKQIAGRLIERMTELLQARKEGRIVLNSCQKQELFDMNEQKNKIYEQIDTIAAEKEKLAKKMKEGENSWISVTDRVYRGTIICIDVVKLPVMSEQTYVRYICQNDVIEVTPIIRMRT